LRKNPRAGIRLNQYKSIIIESRRDKVKQLFVEGYTQEEISNTLHLSQATVSRDLQYINDKLTSKFSQEDARNFMTEYHIASLGLDQIIRSLWKLVNNPKPKFKEKLNALISLRQCSVEKLFIINHIANDRILPYIQNQMEELSRREVSINSKENEIARREKILEDFCKQNNIEFDLIDRNSNS
jgi:predicted transcriptional regulator